MVWNSNEKYQSKIPQANLDTIYNSTETKTIMNNTVIWLIWHIKAQILLITQRTNFPNISERQSKQKRPSWKNQTQPTMINSLATTHASEPESKKIRVSCQSNLFSEVED